MGTEVQSLCMVSTDITEAGGSAMGLLLLVSGNEDLSLYLTLFTPPWWGVGAPHYNLMRVEVYAA